MRQWIPPGSLRCAIGKGNRQGDLGSLERQWRTLDTGMNGWSRAIPKNMPFIFFFFFGSLISRRRENNWQLSLFIFFGILKPQQCCSEAQTSATRTDQSKTSADFSHVARVWWVSGHSGADRLKSIFWCSSNVPDLIKVNTGTLIAKTRQKGPRITDKC